MKLRLYKNKSKDIVVNKTLTDKKEIDIKSILELNYNIKNPYIKISRELYDLEYNYVSIDNRFYYIENIEFMTNNIVKIYLNLDLLMTYKDYIKTLKCIIIRKKDSKYIFKDEKVVTSYIKQYEQKNFRGLDDREGQGCYLLITSQYDFSTNNDSFETPPSPPDLNNPLE